MKRKILNNLEILVGCIIYVIGINFFLVPANIFTTGLMGLAQEITQTLNILLNLQLKNTDSIFLLLQTIAYWSLNIPILIFGFFKISKKFTLKTLIVSSILVQFFINILVIDHSLITDINGEITLASEFLSLLTGSILIGVGLGLIIKNQASSGGTDIIAVYLSLFKGKSFGMYNLLINLLVVVWAIILTGDITKGILILISLYIQGNVVDLIYNYNKKITLMIFTRKEEEIGNFILKEKRSYTSFDGQTGYNKENLKILITIINEEEKARYMQNFINIDEDVFIDVFASGVVGNFKNKYLSTIR